MYTLIIKCDTCEEFLSDLEKLAALSKETRTHAVPQPSLSHPPVNPPVPPPVNPPVPPTPWGAAPVVQETAMNVSHAPTFPANSNPLPPVPTAAPTYTRDMLALAGASLLQSSKDQEARGLFKKYGIRDLNELKPDLYGAFAADLRALGAQL